MKFFDKKLKVGFATFFGMLLVILEFGILDEMHYTLTEGAYGISSAFKSITKSLGYNFCVMSIVILVLTLGYAAYIGYHKNWGGLIGMVLIGVSPFIGQLFGMVGNESLFNVFYGWGTAHLFPMITLLFGPKDPAAVSHALQLIIFAAVLAAYIVLWLIGYRAKKAYEAKNPW